MASLTARTRIALLFVIAICAGVAAYALWPTAAKEPAGRPMGFIDTPGEKEQLEQMLREGRVRLVKPEEIQSELTDEQKALLQRRTTGR
ncbi:MAG: hypothetical protein LW806_05600 [Planctomycetaceae bacterium]|jgi:hypothetical protein|nr:hypothetical protein [Planctomycetaceae bacterium]